MSNTRRIKHFLRIQITSPSYEQLNSPDSASATPGSPGSQGSDSDSSSSHTLQVPYQAVNGSPRSRSDSSSSHTLQVPCQAVDSNLESNSKQFRHASKLIHRLAKRTKGREHFTGSGHIEISNNQEFLASIEENIDLFARDQKSVIEFIRIRLMQIASGDKRIISNVRELLHNRYICDLLFLGKDSQQEENKFERYNINEGARLAMYIFSGDFGQIKNEIYDYLQNTPSAAPILHQVLEILRLKWLEIEKNLDLSPERRPNMITQNADRHQLSFTEIFSSVSCMLKYALSEENRTILFKAISCYPMYFRAIFKKNPDILEKNLTGISKEKIISFLHRSSVEVEKNSKDIAFFLELQIQFFAELFKLELQPDGLTMKLKLKLDSLTDFEKDMIAKALFILGKLVNEKEYPDAWKLKNELLEPLLSNEIYQTIYFPYINRLSNEALNFIPTDCHGFMRLINKIAAHKHVDPIFEEKQNASLYVSEMLHDLRKELIDCDYRLADQKIIDDEKNKIRQRIQHITAFIAVQDLTALFKKMLPTQNNPVTFVEKVKRKIRARTWFVPVHDGEQLNNMDRLITEIMLSIDFLKHQNLDQLKTLYKLARDVFLISGEKVRSVLDGLLQSEDSKSSYSSSFDLRSSSASLHSLHRRGSLSAQL